MTEKLYYLDAYIEEFDAKILSAEESGGIYKIVLDRTAFFPEEGGQSADGGTIGGVAVEDVRESNGVIYHHLRALPAGESVHCRIDFNSRFEKMQCHTAEHILCGIIHKLYGYENVGFHLGDDVVTFDVDGELSAEDIERVELLANKAVFENRAVTASFPTPDELSALEYRAKLELTENVRIVDIDGVDSCACCAPHVLRTGEIGLIKIVDFMRHRGGMRLFMQAGHRALADYRLRYSATRAIGAMTSTPSLEIVSSVERVLAERDALSLRISELSLAYIRAMADTFSPEGENAVVLLENADADAMREFANRAVGRVDGILAVLVRADSGYRYVLASESVDLRARAKEINAALSGKGGGRPEMISGSFSCDIDSIRSYFAK